MSFDWVQSTHGSTKSLSDRPRDCDGLSDLLSGIENFQPIWLTIAHVRIRIVVRIDTLVDLFLIQGKDTGVGLEAEIVRLRCFHHGIVCPAPHRQYCKTRSYVRLSFLRTIVPVNRTLCIDSIFPMPPSWEVWTSVHSFFGRCDAITLLYSIFQPQYSWSIVLEREDHTMSNFFLSSLSTTSREMLGLYFRQFGQGVTGESRCIARVFKIPTQFVGPRNKECF